MSDDSSGNTRLLDHPPVEGTRYTREQIDATLAATGYDLDQHPAHIIRKAHQRATTCFQTVMTGEDLTPTQFAALATILRYGDVSQNHLGRLTAMDPSTISLVVRKLRKLGLVARSASSTDQRMVIITLTNKGVDYTLQRLAKSREAGQQLLAPLSSAEQALLLELLKRIGDE
ncbi:MarR family transcriptional regulator [Kaistia sp. 32K]|uniref:MarR family winged helix-turn-helix transcriptional regulator n=1 Tax=Kaistia sp. 32K TaxID=2795690 RepID=UPI001915AB87|nr:MarR family transcriptional regulator [Kaistia sp. 32K]BCP52060.1 MarR family transcriptional regulator [Kaistia sp. 32K]